jgi:hypothetical protein
VPGLLRSESQRSAGFRIALEGLTTKGDRGGHGDLGDHGFYVYQAGAQEDSLPLTRSGTACAAWDGHHRSIRIFRGIADAAEAKRKGGHEVSYPSPANSAQDPPRIEILVP